MSTHDPKVVEAIAEALYLSEDDRINWTLISWEDAHDEQRNEWRRMARAALDAIDALYEDTPVVGGIEGGL
jgi:hypothetical protein